MSIKEESRAQEDDHIEYVLKDIGGTYGRFQIINYVLFSLTIGFSGLFVLVFVFSALSVDYRCQIPECDNPALLEFKPNWLSNAVPFQNNNPEKCYRYERLPHNNSAISYNQGHNHINDPDVIAFCEASLFNRSSRVYCKDDGFIFKSKEISIVNEFDITCEENQWKLAMVGAMGNFGKIFIMPLIGHFSDRFGRLKVLIVGLTLSCSLSLIKSFATNYYMFLVLEFLDGTFASGTYPTSFILALEWASVHDRVLVSTLILMAYPIGNALTGVIAYYTMNFRALIRAVSIPGLLVISYWWIAPESIRWLLVKKKYKRLTNTLQRAARLNNVKLSQRTLDLASGKYQPETTSDENPEANRGTNSLKEIFTTRCLIIRFIVCAFCWMTNTLVTYGLNLTSVGLKGDIYSNFIIISMAGLPGVFLGHFMLQYMGRRWAICSALIITGASTVISKYLPSDYYILPLILFFTAKVFVSASFNSLYVYTTELWPTNLRHSMMGFCSTIGRFGSTLAPVTPLLSYYYVNLPFLIFALMATTSGLTILLLPETYNTKLPDTVEEAKNIGQTKFNSSKSSKL